MIKSNIKNALIHKDVFLLVKTYFEFPTNKDYSDDNYLNDININIELLNDENISLIFEREEFNRSKSLNDFKLKLP